MFSNKDSEPLVLAIFQPEKHADRITLFMSVLMPMMIQGLFLRILIILNLNLRHLPGLPQLGPDNMPQSAQASPRLCSKRGFAP